ncbi:unnamed protein product [Peronospora belbahrii]|uniref:Exonuclease 1 n=1 Tax=Peronospora belbahrii TaxID=622444 RepID=A0AAU9KQS9_9STRA|nr:unnamed protein product [Peronospora belbahrii]CAH0520829.1 unnamed protein product [Peronospora belbahrii]
MHFTFRAILSSSGSEGKRRKRTDATMGISGLLPALRSITETKSIEEYKGHTLAIDGYCWLHRAIYSCSQEICLGQETDKYVTYFMDRITSLQRNGVIPYVVFDGGPVPMKKDTEEERRKSRQKNRELGIQHFHNKRFSEARKCFVRAADVSPYIAHRVIQQLKKQNVSYVVAPYEADAQLAYLVKSGLAHGVITEDSDCLLFGCQVVLFKMDRDNAAQEIQMANLKKNKGMSFHTFTDRMFLEMCIFSGCDYLPSIPGFGLKKAYTAMKLHGSFTKIVRALRLEGKVRVPATYEDNFRKAVLTFQHQRVYCPIKKEMVPLTPIPSKLLEDDPAMDFVGPLLPRDVARAVADGDMDPITMKRFPTHVTLSCCNSSQLSPAMSKIEAAHKFRAPNPDLKAGTASFVHASESDVVAVSNAPRSSPAAVKRKLPPSFVDKWTFKALLHREKRSEKAITHSSVKNVAASPLVISRFFEGNSVKMSPPDESAKTTLPYVTDSSSYESQEPSGVDLASNMSFDPQSDKSRVLLAQVLKKKQAPDYQEAVQKPATAKETAFSRMMRAGSILKQHELKKRKVATPKFRQPHRDPVISQIKQFAFSNNGESPDASLDASVEPPTSTLKQSGDEKIHAHQLPRK